MYSYTINNNLIDYSNPERTIINRADIATRLSRMYRFAGDINWTVAQHSVLVLNLLESKIVQKDFNIKYSKTLALQGFTHDFHEYAIGDIPTPLKRVLGDKINTIADAIDLLIYKEFNIRPPTKLEKRDIKIVDTLALFIEGYEFKHPLIDENLISSEYFQYTHYFNNITTQKREAYSRLLNDAKRYDLKRFNILLHQLQKSEIKWQETSLTTQPE